MNAKTFYHTIFIGNEPYKNRSEILNNRMKRQMAKSYVKLDEDDYWNFLMIRDLLEPIKYYVRKFISVVFKILTFKISKSKVELQSSISRNSEHPLPI